MFLPAESLFAEIHGHLGDLVEHAQRRGVWLASPTTLFAILHTAAAVIKDASTRARAEQIRIELRHLAADFGRFDQRLDSLARHYAQLGRDLEELQTSGRQLSRRFHRIEAGDGEQ
jgi:DNA recombination protein RmuC